MTGWDVWECTHVGGDRFAANMVVLPTGDMFGRLDADTAPDVLTAYAAGRLLAEHHRGRSGTTPVEQAVTALVAREMSDDRHGAVIIGPTRQVSPRVLAGRNLLAVGAVPDEMWEAAVVHAGTGYVSRIGACWAPPARLQCSGGPAVRARRFALESLALIRPERLVPR